jgi:hypothetical protein
MSAADKEDSFPIMPSTLWELVGPDMLLLAQAESEIVAIAQTATILKNFLLAKWLMISK